MTALIEIAIGAMFGWACLLMGIHVERRRVHRLLNDKTLFPPRPSHWQIIPMSKEEAQLYDQDAEQGWGNA